MFFANAKVAEKVMTVTELREAVKNQIDCLGAFSLRRELLLHDLSNSPKEVKTCVKLLYKEMHKRGWDISVVDFVCWLSTSFICEEVKKIFVSNDEIAATIRQLVPLNRNDVKNALRLFHKNENHLLNALELFDPATRKRAYLEIMEIRYDIIHDEISAAQKANFSIALK
jgi:hypothetical protein